jgi:glycerol uptake facilitator-like aquaporin
MLITFLLLSLWPIGLAFGQYSNANIAIYALAIIAIFVAVSAFSEACLNPLVTVGMMATRRMSVIRGVLYIIAEIIGALLGWLIIDLFKLAGGETAMDMPAMAAIGENGFWLVAMVELVGAIIIGFFFARALKVRRSVFTFAAVVTGGILLAYFVAFIVSAAYLGLNNNFVMNPAVALILQIFPTAGESFGEILGGICQALSIYAIFPMIGGVAGFYLSDFAGRIADEK